MINVEEAQVEYNIKDDMKIDITKNESVEEIKSALLTRVQGSNDRKCRTFGKKLPEYIANVLSELDAFYIE